MRVPDAVLVLQDHEDAGEEVGDEVAGTETDRHTRHAREASSGARSIWNVPRIIRAAVPRITNEATERSTLPIASERCRRRSALTSSPPSAVPSTAWPCGSSVRSAW